jgi:hypothetical protein
MGQAIQKLKGSADGACGHCPRGNPNLLILLKKPIQS